MHWEPMDVFYTRVEDCQHVGSVGTKKFRECETRNTGAESAESGAICWRSRPALILLSRGSRTLCPPIPRVDFSIPTCVSLAHERTYTSN